MTDRFVDHYDIQRDLGRGAPGVAYLARDTRLRNRPAAQKISHPVLSSDLRVARLFHNARTATVQPAFSGKEPMPDVSLPIIAPALRLETPSLAPCLVHRAGASRLRFGA